MIPKIIHLFWAGAFPKEMLPWHDSIAGHHPDWEINLWTPDTIEVLGLDCNALKFDCVNWAGVSNIVRLHAVNKFGGVWLDSDCEVLKPLDPLLERNAFAARQDGDRICNAVFGAVAEHHCLKWQIAREQQLRSEDAAQGVYLMSEAPRDGVTILPMEYFYPFSYNAKPEDRKAHPDSFLIHHWKGSWTK